MTSSKPLRRLGKRAPQRAAAVFEFSRLAASNGFHLYLLRFWFLTVGFCPRVPAPCPPVRWQIRWQFSSIKREAFPVFGGSVHTPNLYLFAGAGGPRGQLADLLVRAGYLGGSQLVAQDIDQSLVLVVDKPDHPIASRSMLSSSVANPVARGPVAPSSLSTARTAFRADPDVQPRPLEPLILPRSGLC